MSSRGSMSGGAIFVYVSSAPSAPGAPSARHSFTYGM
jgi:hypothetical protein